MKKLDILKSIIFTLITIAIFVIWFSKINISDIAAILKKTNIKLLFVAIFISFVGKIIMSSEKWRLILKSLGCNLSFRETLFIKMGSAPIKFLTPARSAELLRPLYLKKYKNFSVTKGALSLLTALILNLLVLTGIVMLTCFLFRTNPYKFAYISFFIVISLSMILLLVRIDKRRMSLFFIYSVTIVSFELINFSVLSFALGLSIPYQAILIFIPAVIIISNLPITIGGLGTRETAIVFFLSKYASRELLLSAGILFSFVEYILPVIVGFIFVRNFLSRLLILSPSSERRL